MIAHIKNLSFGRAAKHPGSLSHRRQRGAVDMAAVLLSLLATILALKNNGFDIAQHPELVTRLESKCSGVGLPIPPGTDRAAMIACANAMIQVAATGFLESANGAAGMAVLSLADTTAVDLGVNLYTIISDVAPKPLTPGTNPTVTIKVADRESTSPANEPLLPVEISVTGTNGYSPPPFQGQASYSRPYTFSHSGGPAGTTFTYAVTAARGGLTTVTKTFTATVNTPPSYTGTFQVQGTVQNFINWRNTLYTCSCTLTQTGTATATFDQAPYGGIVRSPNGIHSTLASCATTPAGVDACYPFHSGSSWDSPMSSVFAVTGSATTWYFLDYGPCSSKTTFSGTITDTSISGTVIMTPQDPTYQYCTVNGVASQFTLQRNNNPALPAHPVSALPR